MPQGLKNLKKKLKVVTNECNDNDNSEDGGHNNNDGDERRIKKDKI